MPLRGVCELINIQEETILGESHVFYELKPSRSKGKLKIPAKQLESHGIRPLLTPEEMEALLQPVDSPPKPTDEESWQRMKRWQSMLRTGGPQAAKQVLLELKVLEKRGLLTEDKEAQELQRRLYLHLRDEIQLVFNLSAAHAGRKLNEALRTKH